MGNAAKIHPVLVVFALIAGEHSYGLVGALFAVPVASIIQTIFIYYRRRPKRPRAATTPPPVVRRRRSDRRTATRSSAAVGADDQRRAIGDVVPAGARRDVAVRLDDDRAQRLVRDAAPVRAIAAIVAA
jgi:hypothetical protein